MVFPWFPQYVSPSHFAIFSNFPPCFPACFPDSPFPFSPFFPLLSFSFLSISTFLPFLSVGGFFLVCCGVRSKLAGGGGVVFVVVRGGGAKKPGGFFFFFFFFFRGHFGWAPSVREI